MCGIVGAIAQRDVALILLEGLKRLEYRGYDSAGLALLNTMGSIERLRTVGKVAQLLEAYQHNTIKGALGIAHTRWATHGKAVERNAHPHRSSNIMVVHNGIIENYEILKQELQHQGYNFSSETDTEVIAHAIHAELQNNQGSLLQSVQCIIPKLKGAYGIVVINAADPSVMVVARSGSPLVIGYGIGENFVSSDPLALLPVTQKVSFLEEGDVAAISLHKVSIFDKHGEAVTRKIIETAEHYEAVGKEGYRHFMQKEIFEQPQVVKNTLAQRLSNGEIVLDELGMGFDKILSQIEHIHIAACGTSYFAGFIARYWIESLLGIPCEVEIASEFRYRNPASRPNSLFLTLSQSGETADTLAALKLSKDMGYLASLTICNVASSSLVRESDFTLLTKAGVEIGVASTKAMTTQLTVLLLLIGYFLQKKAVNTSKLQELTQALQLLPARFEQFLNLDTKITEISAEFLDKEQSLFLGRGELYPVAMEGALKLKEISYIHAEPYAAGELKHGPIALVDGDIPIIILIANNHLLDKVKANIEEVRARGGSLYIFADESIVLPEDENVKVIALPKVETITAPLLYILPLQMLAYHVATIKGTDVDQPRNLAKSVTVE